MLKGGSIYGSTSRNVRAGMHLAGIEKVKDALTKICVGFFLLKSLVMVPIHRFYFNREREKNVLRLGIRDKVGIFSFTRFIVAHMSEAEICRLSRTCFMPSD